MRYKAKSKTEIISQNTVLKAEDFGGWQALNAGTSTATINGTPLDPAGSVVSVSFTDLHPSVIWDEPIRIEFTGSGTNKVVITRIKYTESV